MELSRGTRTLLRAASIAILAFIYTPIAIIVLYSFNSSLVATWPMGGLTLDWYVRALNDEGIRNALTRRSGRPSSRCCWGRSSPWPSSATGSSVARRSPSS